MPAVASAILDALHHNRWPSDWVERLEQRYRDWIPQAEHDRFGVGRTLHRGRRPQPIKHAATNRGIPQPHRASATLAGRKARQCHHQAAFAQLQHDTIVKRIRAGLLAAAANRSARTAFGHGCVRTSRVCDDVIRHPRHHAASFNRVQVGG